MTPDDRALLCSDLLQALTTQGLISHNALSQALCEQRQAIARELEDWGATQAADRVRRGTK